MSGRLACDRRRSALLQAACAALLALACSDDRAASPSAQPPARNLVILCLDTLRFDHLGSYGYERPTSPTLDSLAAAGVVVEEAYSHSPWTLPATVSLLSSLYPSQHGAQLPGEVKHLEKAKPVQLRESAPVLADLLRAAGFRTGLFSANPFLGGELARRFDAAEVQRRPTPDLNALALAWLDGLGGERFFLHLQYMDLHEPLAPPEPYFNFFPVADGAVRGPQHAKWPAEFVRLTDASNPEFQSFSRHKVALYDGALRYLDEQIRGFLEALEARGLKSETLFIVTSDHGEEFWDHAALESRLGGDPRGVWGVGHGHSMFQELIRVPLIFHGAAVPAGSRIACPSGQIDVVPTALELLGLPGADGLRGESLVPRFAGRRERPCPPRPMIAESPAYGPDAQAVIWKKRKLIVRDDGVSLLFDLEEDPGEAREVVSSLSTILAAELSGPPAGRDGAEMEFDEETLEQLRALGYLQ